jgi:hypothetical protein
VRHDVVSIVASRARLGRIPEQHARRPGGRRESVLSQGRFGSSAEHGGHVGGRPSERQSWRVRER